MDPLTSAINTILVTWGLPGALLVIMGFALWSRDKALRASEQGRLADARENITAAIALQAAITTSQDSMKAATLALTTYIPGLQRDVEATNDKLDRLNAMLRRTPRVKET